MTLVADKYYRKISKNIDNLKIKFDISTLMVKSKEHDVKIENIYDKDYIDNNFLQELQIDKKDNAILNKVNDNFYSRSYINDNYHLKNNVYNKQYIVNNYFSKRTLNNTFANFYARIDSKDNELYEKIKNNYYDKSELNNKISKLDKNIVLFNQNLTNHIDTYKNKITELENNKLTETQITKINQLENIDLNNLYNRQYLNNKFDDIYNKNEVNKKISTLNNNIVIFNNDLTKFINETYKKNQESIYNKIDKNSLSDININKINQLSDIDLGKINSSYNFSVFNKNKLEKIKYYINEFINFDISLVKKFTIIGDMNEIMILQFELDQRMFDKDDVFNFFLNTTIQYESSKTNYYRLKLKFDILYDDESLIKQFIKTPISKGLVYHNLMNFNINNFFKLSKKTEKIIFKIYMNKINTSLKNDIIFTLTNTYENNYCNLIHYKSI